MTHPLQRSVAILLASLLVLAPLLRSGNTPLALLTLEVLALALLGLLAWQPGSWQRLTRLQRWAVGGLAAVPLLYLLPLPSALAAFFPGREMHQLAQSLALRGGQPDLETLALSPAETFAGWLKLLLPLGVFVAALQLPHRTLQWLVWLFLGMAALQAMIGLLQYGGGLPMPELFGMDDIMASRAAGTYTSPNNFAGFLYLALMLSLALYLAWLGRFRSAGKSPLRSRLLFWSTLRGHQTFIFGALALLLLLGIIFSRSRAGIGVTIIGIALLTVMLSNRIGGAKAGVGLVGRVLTVAMGAAAAIGLAPVWQRFTVADPVSDGRFVIFDGTLRAIRENFPLGYGPGSFQESFFPWQDVSQSAYLINQAHNSFLEWLYDGGLLALALLLLCLTIYVRRWFTLWRREAWGDFRYLQVGAGVGLLLMLLHEMADYNLYVPANMIAFAFLAAVFLYPYQEAAPKRRKSTSRIDARRERDLAPLPTAATNPFMD